MVGRMDGIRVLAIGGTSHVGKSTVGRAIAERLGFVHMSTDGLARHPGRPWRTLERDVPRHVAAHYRLLSVPELVESVLAHYALLWPRIARLITTYADADIGAGLVLEGSAVWPGRVAELAAPRTAAVWLTADDAVLRERMYASSGYAAATEAERRLIDAFLARAQRFQAVMVDEVDRLGLVRIDAGRDVAGLVRTISGGKGRG